MDGYIALQRIAEGETVTALNGTLAGARIYLQSGNVNIIRAGSSAPYVDAELTQFINEQFEIVKAVDFEEAVSCMLSGKQAERYDNGRTLIFSDNQFMTPNDEGVYVPTTITPSDYEQTWRISDRS